MSEEVQSRISREGMNLSRKEFLLILGFTAAGSIVGINQLLRLSEPVSDPGKEVGGSIPDEVGKTPDLERTEWEGDVDVVINLSKEDYKGAEVDEDKVTILFQHQDREWTYSITTFDSMGEVEPQFTDYGFMLTGAEEGGLEVASDIENKLFVPMVGKDKLTGKFSNLCSVVTETNRRLEMTGVLENPDFDWEKIFEEYGPHLTGFNPRVITTGTPDIIKQVGMNLAIGGYFNALIEGGERLHMAKFFYQDSAGETQKLLAIAGGEFDEGSFETGYGPLGYGQLTSFEELKEQAPVGTYTAVHLLLQHDVDLNRASDEWYLSWYFLSKLLQDQNIDLAAIDVFKANIDDEVEVLPIEFTPVIWSVINKPLFYEPPEDGWMPIGEIYQEKGRSASLRQRSRSSLVDLSLAAALVRNKGRVESQDSVEKKTE